MTPDLWILWVFMSFGGTITSQAAAFHTETACRAAETKLVAAFKTGGRTILTECTPNFQMTTPQ